MHYNGAINNGFLMDGRIGIIDAVVAKKQQAMKKCCRKTTDSILEGKSLKHFVRMCGIKTTEVAIGVVVKIQQ